MPELASLPTLDAPRGLLARIKGRLGKGHPWWGYLVGLLLRRKFDRAGLIAVERGLPLPWVKNEAGTLECENILLYSGTRLWAHKGGRLSIGNGTYLNRGTEVIAWESVSIGRDCMIGWDCVIMDTDLHPVGDRPLRNAPVVLQDRVWLGCRVIVLKGVTIGEGAIVSAGSIVTRDVPPYTVVAGEPARVVGHVDRDHRPAADAPNTSEESPS